MTVSVAGRPAGSHEVLFFAAFAEIKCPFSAAKIQAEDQQFRRLLLACRQAEAALLGVGGSTIGTGTRSITSFKTSSTDTRRKRLSGRKMMRWPRTA